MSFLGSSFSGTADNNFVTPEPKGVDASKWSKYPAEEDVDIAGFNLLNVNNISVAGEINLTSLDLEDLTITNNLEVQNETLLTKRVQCGDNVIVFGQLLVSDNITANSNLSLAQELTVNGNITANTDLYVSGTSFVHGVEALDAISVVSPSVANKFSMEYSESVGIPKMTLTSDGGTSQEYIRLSDVPSGLIQLLTPSEVDADMTITTGGLYATDDGVYAGEGTGVAAFNAGLECDTGTSTGSIVLKSGVATNPIIDFNTAVITFQKDIIATGDITQTGGTTTLQGLEVLDATIKMPTPSLNLLELKVQDKKLVTANSNEHIVNLFNPTSGAIVTRDRYILPTLKPRTTTFTGANPVTLNLIDFDEPMNEVRTAVLFGSGGVVTVRIYEHQNLPMEKLLNIRLVSGSWSCLLELRDAAGNISSSKLFSYMDMSSGTIAGRGVVNQQGGLSIYTDVHSLTIKACGDSPAGAHQIQYYVEYK